MNKSMNENSNKQGKHVIITLNVSGLNQLKEYQNGQKKKTELYVVYKKPTLNINTQIKCKGMEKDIPC